MSRRSEQLRAVATEFCRVHDDWVEDKNRTAPDRVYWDAVDALIESFDSGDVPADCRELAEAVDKLADETREFDDRDDPRETVPRDKFWEARQHVADALAGQKEKKSRPPLESIAALKAQGVGDVQICMIYGFYTGEKGNRRYLTHLVQKELDKPGSVLNDPQGVDGKPWRDPRGDSDDATSNASAERHAAAIAGKRRRGEKAAGPCPESPQDLWQQGVTVKQAAKMLGKDEAEVSDLWSYFEAEHERQLREGEKVDAVTQAIRERAAKGETVAQISKEMKLDPKKVGDAIKGMAATASVPAGAGA